MLIYKILRADEWNTFNTSTDWRGVALDLSDGYIHFSTAQQAPQTAHLHFNGEQGLMLAAFDADAFGPSLVWEKSRGGADFPHVYASIDPASRVWAKPLPLGPDGHIFPAEIT